MSLTTQQQTILDHIISNTGLTMVDAKAGSGKTFLLTEIAKALKPKSALYLCYNKTIAVEAATKFPKDIKCCTTHSLAYKPTITEHKLALGTFNYKSITEKINFSLKEEILSAFKEFCLSPYISISEFCQAKEYSDFTCKLITKYFTQMADGVIDCNYDFYLKYFHISLATGSITYPNFDLIMLDEGGDLNAVTIEIFRLLPATRKVMAGDVHQNIYTFNHTINGFEVLKDSGTIFPMTVSFRVSEPIAELIQSFGQSHLDPTFSFQGIPIKDTTIKTKAFITRTNSALISKMMELNNLGQNYSLRRDLDSIFELPLALCNLSPRGFIACPEYRFIQEDVTEYYSDPDLHMEFKGVLPYLKDTYAEDRTLVNAINLVQRYGKLALSECYKDSKRLIKPNTSMTLGTSHSMKGLEYDEVYISTDLNDAVSDVLSKKQYNPDLLLPQDYSELLLYYVACSRAKKALVNAIHL